jgi:hypothetical protein
VKPQRAEPTVRGRIAARGVDARTPFAHEGQVNRESRHHLVSTTGGAPLLPRNAARTVCTRIMHARIVLPGAPTPDIKVGWQHRGTSIGREIMQYRIGRRETSAATLSEMQWVVNRPPVR